MNETCTEVETKNKILKMSMTRHNALKSLFLDLKMSNLSIKKYPGMLKHLLL